jgi:hypothetical protein
MHGDEAVHPTPYDGLRPAERAAERNDNIDCVNCYHAILRRSSLVHRFTPAARICHIRMTSRDPFVEQAVS